MPKSAEAATRFTSTTPHATSKPSSPAPSNQQALSRAKQGNPNGSVPNRTPGPPGETPQEKVARLRAAAAKTRAANVSTFDRVLVRGRVWADRAHRFTALSLIGITGIAGAVTVYALGDMIIYNRRKRAEYFAEQRALQNAQLHDAQRAMSAGIATEDQVAVVENELKLQNTVKEKNAKKGVWSRGKEWLFSGLKKEDDQSEDVTMRAVGVVEGGGSPVLAKTSTVEEGKIKAERESDVLKVVEDKKNAVQQSARQAFEKEKEMQRLGGPLDRIGVSNTDTPAEKSSGGWTSFMSRR